MFYYSVTPQTGESKSWSRVSGFPPIPGQKVPAAEQGLVAALEAAGKLASTAAAAGDDEEEETEEEVDSQHPYHV